MENYSIPVNKIKEIQEEITNLEQLLDDRISELHKVNGMQQCRHAYIYYRSILWNIKYTLRDNLKEIKK